MDVLIKVCLSDKVYTIKYILMKMKEKGEGFKCSNCNRFVSTAENIGTKNRNHCPYCLYSKHLDSKRAGDRKSDCKSLMKPIGLTFKKEKRNKYKDSDSEGEIMLVHLCTNSSCSKISINRIAGDDEPETIMSVLENSFTLDECLKERLEKINISLISKKDIDSVKRQLFGTND
jgi:CRISPR/Cas system CSM-associated protein Csm3 (group 7 of RAMP superfamily)